MSEGHRELITWILGTGMTVAVIIGMATKFILLPYLREHLVNPMKQVEKQVSENNHTNKTPTILDKIDEVQDSVSDIRQEMNAMSRMYEGHMSWSERWVQLIEREIEFIKQHRREHQQNLDRERDRNHDAE